MPGFDDIRVVFDATSAGAHLKHWEALRDNGVRMLDLTPAAVGPFCVPVVKPRGQRRLCQCRSFRAGHPATPGPQAQLGRRAELAGSAPAQLSGSCPICRRRIANTRHCLGTRHCFGTRHYRDTNQSQPRCPDHGPCRLRIRWHRRCMCNRQRRAARREAQMRRVRPPSNGVAS